MYLLFPALLILSNLCIDIIQVSTEACNSPVMTLQMHTFGRFDNRIFSFDHYLAALMQLQLYLLFLCDQIVNLLSSLFQLSDLDLSSCFCRPRALYATSLMSNGPDSKPWQQNRTLLTDMVSRSCCKGFLLDLSHHSILPFVSSCIYTDNPRTLDGNRT